MSVIWIKWPNAVFNFVYVRFEYCMHCGVFKGEVLGWVISYRVCFWMIVSFWTLLLINKYIFRWWSYTVLKCWRSSVQTWGLALKCVNVDLGQNILNTQNYVKTATNQTLNNCGFLHDAENCMNASFWLIVLIHPKCRLTHTHTFGTHIYIYKYILFRPCVVCCVVFGMHANTQRNWLKVFLYAKCLLYGILLQNATNLPYQIEYDICAWCWTINYNI